MATVISQVNSADTRSRAMWIFGLLGMMPIAAVLFLWDFGPDEAPLRQFMARNSLAIPLLQVIVIAILARSRSLSFDFTASFNRLDKVVLAFFSLSILYASTMVALDPASTMLAMVKFYLLGLFVISVAPLSTIARPQAFNLFWQSVGFSTLGYTILWAVDFTIYPPAEMDWIKRIPGVTNIRWTGFFWLSAFAAGMIYVGRRNNPKFLLGVLFGSFGLALVIWTGSRGGLLAIAAASAGAMIFSVGYRKQIAVYSLLSLLIAAAINIAAPVPDPQYGLGRILSYASDNKQQKRIDTGRVELWQETLELAKSNIITGHGIDQYGLMGPQKIVRYKAPHNFPLQLLFSVGLVGIFAFVYGSFRLLGAFRFSITYPYQVSAFAFLVGGVVYSLYDNFLYYPYPITMATICVLMLVCRFDGSFDDLNQPKSRPT